MQKWISVLLIVLFYATPSYCKEKNPIRISGLSSYAPVMWAQNNTLQGIAADVAKKVFGELQVPFRFQVLPWKRAQAYAASGKIDVIAGIYKTRQRQAYMTYSVPFMQDPGVLFVKKGNVFPYKKWEDLVGRNGITNRGYSWGGQFDLFIAARLHMDYIDTPEQGFQMLVMKDRKIDYYLYGLIPGLLVVNRLGLEAQIDYIPNYVTEENFYFAFSKKSEYVKLLPAVNTILNRLVAEKYVDFLISRYTNAWTSIPAKKRTH